MLVQSPKRPSVGMMTQRKVKSIAFGPIKSRLTLAIEAGDQSLISELKAAGAIEFEISGECLASMGAVEGLQVATLTEQLTERFVNGDESLFGLDTSAISEKQCQSVAIVRTAILSLDGEEPYNCEELLAMPLTEEGEELWLALMQVGMDAYRGKLKPQTNTESR